MAFDDLQMAALNSRIGEAPFAPETWGGVLGDVSLATGGWGGQLIGVGGGHFQMYLADKDLSVDMMEALTEQGGGDPVLNPRAAAAFASRPMVVYTDQEMVSDAVRSRNAIYNGLFLGADAPWSIAAVLMARQEMRVMVTTLRTTRQGLPDGNQREVFAALLPAFNAAVRLQIRLEGQAGALALGALDQLGAAAVLCDAWGRIMALSAAAETMLRDQDMLVQRQGRLRAAQAVSDLELSDALVRLASWRHTLTLGNSTVLLRSRTGAPSQAAEVIALPRSSGAFALGARCAVVIGRGFRPRANALIAKLGLTSTEAEVARAAAEGFSPAEIAAARVVSLATVRTQLKIIYAKLDVRSQRELTVKLRGVL